MKKSKKSDGISFLYTNLPGFKVDKNNDYQNKPITCKVKHYAGKKGTLLKDQKMAKISTYTIDSVNNVPFLPA